MSVDPSSRLAQAEASIAALWARMNTITNAGGQVTIIGSGSGGGPVNSIGVKAAGSSVLASGLVTLDFRSGLSAVLDGTTEIDVALGNLTAAWTQSGDFAISHAGILRVGDGGAASALETLNATRTITDPSGTTYGLRLTPTMAQTSSANRTLNGLNVSAAISGNGLSNTSVQNAINSSFSTGTNQTLSGVISGIRSAVSTGTAGTLSDIRAIYVITTLASGSTTTDAYGIYIPVPTGSGSATNVYGLYIENQTKGGTLNRAIYSAGGVSVHAGAFAIGSTTAPVASALTEWTSTTQGLLIPRMTKTQRDAISSPATALNVYNTDSNTHDFYDGTAWRQVDSSDGNQYATVSTTDATVTTLATITCAASTTTQIEARVSARRTGGSGGTAEDGAAYVIRAAIKNVAGTATIIGAVNADFTAEDQAGWDATIDVTGATARVRVTGAANNNINWKAQVRTLTVS